MRRNLGRTSTRARCIALSWCVAASRGTTGSVRRTLQEPSFGDGCRARVTASNRGVRGVTITDPRRAGCAVGGLGINTLARDAVACRVPEDILLLGPRKCCTREFEGVPERQPPDAALWLITLGSEGS